MAGSSNPHARFNLNDEDIDSFTPTSDSTVQISQSSRKKTSTVWEHFENFENEDRAHCKLCGQDFKHKRGTGTGTLSRHLSTHRNLDEPQAHQTQLNISDRQLGANFKNSQTHAREGMTEWVIKSELPFSASDDPNFEYYAQNCLNPQYRRIPRSSNRAQIGKLFETRKSMLIESFSKLTCKFALTSDVWKAITNEHYICVTAHWIDCDWHLQKRIIGFQRFEHPHTGTAISRCIINITREFNISDKIFCISFDNASNNTASISLLKEQFSPILNGLFFHNRCACHILNLAVQDALQSLEVIIKPIRDAVLFIRTSSVREQEFKRMCRESGKRYRKFKLDVPTRWNSTAHLLDSTFDYQLLLIAFYNDNIGSSSHFYLSENHFKLAKQLHDILQIVEEATIKLSSSYSSTTHAILPYLVSILFVLNTYREDELFCVAIEAMESKLMKYFENLPLLYCIATVLDPQLKSSGLDDLLDLYVQSSSFVSLDKNNIKSLTNTTLANLFDIYSSYIDNSSTSLPTVSSSSNKGKGIASSSNILSRLPFKKPRFNTSSLGELVLYEQTPRIDMEEYPDYDILQWWKSNSHLYPVLSSIARDFLTPPVSTVASESAFSAGGRVLDETRNMMSAQSLEISVCLKDWLDADERKQGLMQQLADETSSGSSNVTLNH